MYRAIEFTGGCSMLGSILVFFYQFAVYLRDGRWHWVSYGVPLVPALFAVAMVSAFLCSLDVRKFKQMWR